MQEPTKRRGPAARIAAAALAIGLTVFVFLAIGAGLQLRQLLSRGHLERELAERLTEELGLEASVKSAAVRGLSRVEASELKLKAPPGAMPLEALELSIGFDRWKLLRGELAPVTFELRGMAADLTSPAKRAALVKTIQIIDERSRIHKPRIVISAAMAKLESGTLELASLSLERPRFGVRSLTASARLLTEKLEPVSLELRGALGGSPAALTGHVTARSAWVDLTADGGIASIAEQPAANATLRLARLEPAKLPLPHLAVTQGAVSGVFKVSGPPDALALEGEAIPTDLVLELPKAGSAAVRAGTAKLEKGRAVLAGLVLETSAGVFEVEGTIAGASTAPVLDLEARSASVDVAPLLRKAGYQTAVEGGSTGVFELRGPVSAPRLSARMQLVGLVHDLRTERFGNVQVKVASASVSYENERLEARGVDLKVWGAMLTGDFTVDRPLGAAALTARATGTDVDVSAVGRYLPPGMKRAFDRYKPRGTTSIFIEASGSAGSYTGSLAADASGLAFSIPVKPDPVAVTFNGGRLVLGSDGLAARRLSGILGGSPFSGDISVSNLLDSPNATGEVQLRKVRLDRLAPAAARKYDIRGTPDVKVSLPGKPANAYVLACSARGLHIGVEIDPGTRMPIDFSAGSLTLDRGVLTCRDLEGSVAGGRFQGEATIQDALGTPRTSGRATIADAPVERLMAAVARKYSLEGPIDAQLEFDGPKTQLGANLAGLRTRVPAGQGFLTLDIESGKLAMAEGTAKISNVVLTQGGQSKVRVDGVAGADKLDLSVRASGLEARKLLAAAAGTEVALAQQVTFEGKVRAAKTGTGLSGRFELQGNPKQPSVLDGVTGTIDFDGSRLKFKDVKVAGCSVSIDGVKTPRGLELKAQMPAAPLAPLLAKLPQAAGVATGQVEAAFQLSTGASGPAAGRGAVTVKKLVVDGGKVASKAGIENQSMKLRGAGGFLSLGLLPSIFQIPGQVAAGQLNMNARYVDFAFGQHDLGDVKWDFKLDGTVLEGRVTSAPNAEKVKGDLKVDLASSAASGKFSIFNQKDNLTMKVDPLMLDTRQTPPVRTPDGIKNVEFTGAGDAFTIAGTAGAALMGNVLKGGLLRGVGGGAALGPATLVPMLLFGPKRAHKPYKGLPGQKPSAAEATVLHPQKR